MEQAMTAYELGRAAWFRAAIRRPYSGKALMDMIQRGEDAAALCKDWLRGWDTENMKGEKYYG